MVRHLVSFAKGEKGATAIEYALIAALVSVMIVAAVTILGTTVSGTFASVGSSL